MREEDAGVCLEEEEEGEEEEEEETAGAEREEVLLFTLALVRTLFIPLLMLGSILLLVEELGLRVGLGLGLGLGLL